MEYDVYLIDQPWPKKFKQVMARNHFQTLDEANKWVASLETHCTVKIVEATTRKVIWSSEGLVNS